MQFQEGEDDSQHGSEDEMAGLEWATSTLLDAGPSSSGMQRAPSCKQQSSQTQPKVSSPAKATTPQKSVQKTKGGRRVPESSPPSSQQPSESSPSLIRKKFQGKSAEEILSPHGYEQIKPAMESFVACLRSDAMNTHLRGEELEAFSTACVQQRKQGLTLQKMVVALDIKTKKWTGAPPPVGTLLADLRTQVKTINDALVHFSKSKKQQDSIAMETSKAEIAKLGLHVPLSFHTLYFKEKGLDLMRFLHFESFVNHVHPKSGYWRPDMFLSGELDTVAVQELALESVGSLPV